MDAILFDALDSQNLDKLKTPFARDLEFYQDNEGPASYGERQTGARCFQIYAYLAEKK